VFLEEDHCQKGCKRILNRGERQRQRYYGAYSNRARTALSSTAGPGGRAAVDAHFGKDNSDSSREARSLWARLLRKIFETDPLLCQCGTRMQIVSFITDVRVVDRILRHRKSERCQAKDPFEPRAPTAAFGNNAQRRR